VYSAEITPEVAKAYNLPVNSGAYLYSSSTYSAIVKDSPAAKAGLKDKDIVTKVNGVEVGKAGTLADLIGEYEPGDTVQLTVIREGNEIAVNVMLEGYKK
jgi:S1-C subfamily serine protease